MHNSEVEVTLTGELLLSDPAFIGFYSGCVGYTGLPVQIAPGDFEVSLVYNHWQLPMWLTPELIENYGDPTLYPCFEELSLTLCPDSINWWTVDQYCEELWNGLIAESYVPLQQSFTFDGSNGFQFPINVVPGSGNLCGEGTVWDSALQQCVSIASPYTPSCGEGTIWDPVNEECIVANPTDTDFDGCVTAGDVLNLLAAFGTCPPYPEWPDEPIDDTWTCGDPLTYWDYDYATVLIGDQCWFAENLRTTTYRDGTPVPEVSDNNEWFSLSTAASCDYNNEPSNTDIHGRLYNWFVLDNNHLCPSEWHVSTDSEWTQLEEHMDNLGHDVLSLMTPSDWNNHAGSDLLGFSALPSGYRQELGTFGQMGNLTNWWTATSNDFDGLARSWARMISPDYFLHLHRGSWDHRFGFSVRCIKD